MAVGLSLAKLVADLGNGECRRSRSFITIPNLFLCNAVAKRRGTQRVSGRINELFGTGTNIGSVLKKCEKGKVVIFSAIILEIYSDVKIGGFPTYESFFKALIIVLDLLSDSEKPRGE